MNIWENAVITTKGLSLLSKLMEGNTLTITRAESGEGFVTPGLLVQQTHVTLPKQALVFSPVSYPEEGKCTLPCYITNEKLSTGYTAKQVGIYAMDPDEGEILFFIAQSTSDKGTEIPSEAEMPGYSAEWTFYFQYGQADGVSVTVDPSNSVSREEMEVLLAEKAPTQFVMTTTRDKETGTDSMDKTFAELQEAYEAGRQIRLVNESGMEFELLAFGANYMAYFAHQLDTVRYLVGFKANGTVTYVVQQDVATHNKDTKAHNDIRVKMEELANKVEKTGGKRATRITIGTSVNGWTEKDCDYLCDSITDDAEINNAIKALPATGGEIVLLDGTYNVTTSIKLNKANVVLRGNGSSTKLVRGFIGSSTNPAAIYMTGANCVVCDIAIDGAKESYKSKNYCLGIKSTGENNTIEDCNIFNHEGDAIYVGANHNIVVGNTSKENYRGIVVEGHDNIIKGNINTKNEECGISLKDANCNTIIGNVCRMNADQNIFFDASSYNIVSENNCAVLDDDEVSPSISVFISNDTCVGNIVIDNLFGTDRVVNYGTNNDCGIAIPNTRKINDKALDSDITLSASDVGAAPSGYGLGSALPGQTIKNCNDAIQTGWYKVSAGATNAPVATEFLMRVEMSSVSSGVQTAFFVDTGNIKIKVRGKNAGAWSNWTDGCATNNIFTVSVPNAWTEDTTNGGYKQTVTVSGIVASDNPTVDVTLENNAATNKTYLEAWGCIDRITTATNSITLYAYRNPPKTAFNIQLKVVR